MSDTIDDSDEELNEEELRVVLKSVGSTARDALFAIGQPVYFIKGNALVALYSDGREEILKKLDLKNGVGPCA